MRTEQGKDAEAEGQAGAGGEGEVEGGVEDGESGDEGGEEELGGEDGVDLADERPAQLVLAEGEARVEGAPRTLLQIDVPLPIQPRKPVHLRRRRQIGVLPSLLSKRRKADRPEEKRNAERKIRRCGVEWRRPVPFFGALESLFSSLGKFFVLNFFFFFLTFKILLVNSTMFCLEVKVHY